MLPCNNIDQNTQLQNFQCIINSLEYLYPNMPEFLIWHNAFELLISVILSAQTTDLQVNKCTPALFAQFPDAETLAQADVSIVEELVYTTGFFRVKARNIILASQFLLREHQGTVPKTMVDLVKIPGVGRKSASVILHHVWNQPALIVDTHFARVIRRLGLSTLNNPTALEKDLANWIPQEYWGSLSMRANALGRDFCKARAPNCIECKLALLCPNAHAL